MRINDILSRVEVRDPGKKDLSFRWNSEVQKNPDIVETSIDDIKKKEK